MAVAPHRSKLETQPYYIFDQEDILIAWRTFFLQNNFFFQIL